jgi:sirohydrochlorin cobaltochelatase
MHNDADANGNVVKLARLLWEGRREGLVETCFWVVTGPGVPEGLRRCLALGARRVIVVPYLLFPGLLLSGLAAMIAEQQALLPGVEIVMAPPLGAHPAKVALVLERVAESAAGEAQTNCDLCKYRVPMPGFAADLGL